MRITNTMTINKMLVNINRNATNIDHLYQQYSTGKKIQFPSDDPIVASRALKFRTNVAQTEQYARNTDQGLSWMSITEEGFNNVLNTIEKIAELCNNGATGTLEYADRQKIVETIRAYAEQLGAEMNIQYAGRYVFSGFRTDEPPVIEKADAGAYYSITQSFNFDDIEKVKIYHVQEGSDEPEVYEVYRLKLPYQGNNNTANQPLNVTGFSWTDDIARAAGGALGANQDRDPATGFIWSDESPAAGVDYTYYKTPDPDNPGYSVSTSFTAPAAGVPIDETYQPGYGNANVPNNDKWHYVPETGEIILSKEFVKELQTGKAAEIQITYDKIGLNKGELNPRAYFTCIDKSKDPAVINGNLPLTAANSTPSTWLAFDMKHEDMTFEFGANTRIKINSLAKDVFTPQLYADMMRLVNDIAGIEPTSDTKLAAKYNQTDYPGFTVEELDEMKAKQRTDEMQKYNGVIHEMFNSMLGLMTTHLSQASKEDTALGSRMIRLDLIKERLEADKVSYTKLMSENEDVDYLEVLMNLSNAQNIYQASLKAGASIAQMSLADFI